MSRQPFTPFLPQRDPNKKKFPTLISVHSALLIFIALTFGIGFLLAFTAMIVYPDLLYDADHLADMLYSNFGLYMCNIIFTQLLCMFPAALIALKMSGSDPLQAARLKKGVNPIQLLLLCVVGVGCVIFANGVNDVLLMGMERLGHTPVASLGFQPANIPQLIFSTLLIAGLPAICEEFLFRGVVMRAYERFSPAMAVLMSALLFGLMHGNVDQLFFAFLLGIVLAVVVLVTDSIWASAYIHFFNNAAASVLNYFLASSGEAGAATASERLIGNGVYICVGGVILAAGLAVFIAYTRKRNRKKYGRPLSEELASDFAPTIAEKKYDYLFQREVTLTPSGKSPAATWITFAAFVLYSLFNCLITW